jgi:hypothetical protein
MYGHAARVLAEPPPGRRCASLDHRRLAPLGRGAVLLVIVGRAESSTSRPPDLHGAADGAASDPNGSGGAEDPTPVIGRTRRWCADPSGTTHRRPSRRARPTQTSVHARPGSAARSSVSMRSHTKMSMRSHTKILSAELRPGDPLQRVGRRSRAQAGVGEVPPERSEGSKRPGGGLGRRDEGIIGWATRRAGVAPPRRCLPAGPPHCGPHHPPDDRPSTRMEGQA